MKDDPTITAVRDARRRISQSVQHDPRKLVEYYKQLQQRHRNRLVSESTNRSLGKDDAARGGVPELAETDQATASSGSRTATLA